MKEIKLTQGKVALVDDEDFEYLNQLKWAAVKSHFTFYASYNYYAGSGKYSHIKMHRLLMNPPNDMVIDHINHNGLDNRKENLRIVTHRENCINKRVKCKTGFVGVTKTASNRYRASMTVKYTSVHLGTFDTPELAYEAYLKSL